MARVRPRREALLSRRRALDPAPRSALDRGAVTASIIILPIVIFSILLGIHFSLVLHGRNVATAAAQDGLQAAQLQGATAGNGKQAANNTLALFGGIRNANVTVTRVLNTVTVTVSGEVETPIDGLFNSFEITRTGPLERFYFESERE